MTHVPVLAKPTFFFEKPEEDAEEWLQMFNDIAAANQWNDIRKLQVVAVYLQEAAKRWYDTKRTTLIRWNGAMLTDFTQVFTEKFVTDRKKTKWVREFNQLK